MRDWLNWLGGIMVAIGTALVAGGDGWINTVGVVSVGIGGLLVKREDVSDAAKKITHTGPKLWLVAACLAVLLLGLAMTGCVTSVTRHADGTYTISTRLDEEAALAFAQRSFDEAWSAYQLYREQENAQAAAERERWRGELAYWGGVLERLRKDARANE